MQGHREAAYRLARTLDRRATAEARAGAADSGTVPGGTDPRTGVGGPHASTAPAICRTDLRRPGGPDTGAALGTGFLDFGTGTRLPGTGTGTAPAHTGTGRPGHGHPGAGTGAGRPVRAPGTP